MAAGSSKELGQDLGHSSISSKAETSAITSSHIMALMAMTTVSQVRERKRLRGDKGRRHSQVNRRIWLRSTEAIKFSFVTRNFSPLPAAKCQHMQKTKFQRASHKKIKENKKETKIIILMGKKCAKTTEKSAGKSNLPRNLEIELFTFSFYSFLWLK